MGKRKITNEGSLDSMVLPSSNDVLGVAVKMLGAERITVKCQDGKERICRVTRQTKKARLDSRRRHCFGFTMGFPI